MKLRNLILSLLTVLIVVVQSFAQNGTLRGTVIEASIGETIPFATIVVEGTTTGTTSDLDGKYSLSLAAGVYKIKFSYIGLSDQIIEGVEIKAGEVTILDVNMEEKTQNLQEVVVTARQARNTEAALATIKRKSSNLLDGISSQNFKRIGDSNAGEAIKRVTGVSVEGGKHIYVRGLGDRYTKTIVNGLDIPGLDPDRNSFEMDLFPTTLIDNILVYKSFSPNLPADFTGGVVDIQTKDFPESKTLDISVGLTYNPSMHFNSNFLTQEGGDLDFIGMDDGTRELPFDPKTEIPNPALNQGITTTLTSALGRNLAAMRMQNNLNKSFGVSMGNQLNGDNLSFGYVAALNYKEGTTFFEDAEFNTYIFDEQNFPGQYKLIEDQAVVGDIGKRDVLWSAMLGGSIKSKNHKIGLNLLRIQNGTSSAVEQTIEKSQSSSALLVRDVLEYLERSVTNINLNGRHSFDEGNFQIDWKFSPSFIEVDEPDLRSSTFEQIGENEFQLAPSVGADVTRIWRNLQETNYSGKVDFTKKLAIGADKKSELKFGFLSSIKERDFGINQYLVRAFDQTSLNLQGNPDNLFKPENIWTPGSNRGTYIRGQFEPANTFNASQTLVSGYVMNEIKLTNKLKAIYGARVEKAKINYTGVSNDGLTEINDSIVLDELNILPSLNLVYELADKMNLRFSVNQTLARPSFKEKSIAQIQDRISGRTFIGNLDLLQTEVNNYDLRWEMFHDRGQLISVSGFYKSFTNPIELVPFSDNAPNNFQARNLEGGATVMGVEFEVIRSLDFIHSSLTDLKLGTNVSLVKSEANRNTLIAPGEEKRPMFGQSPYIINANLSYTKPESGLELNLSYNVQGKKLVVVGAGSLADVYDQPVNSLNARFSKQLGKSSRYKLSIGIENILNASNRKEYEAFSGDTGIFELFNPGRSFSFGLSANLF